MIDPDEDDDGVRLPEDERRALWREANGVSNAGVYDSSDPVL